jgi:hypothetical protein
MNKILKLTLAILIIGTLTNFGLLLKKRQDKIVQLKKQNLLLKGQVQIYKTSLKLMFNKNSESLPDTMGYQYAVYFPSQACSKCLEDLLLLIENDVDLKEKLMVYFDDPDRVGIVDHFNDMYGTSYIYITGKPLFHQELSKISLLKINKGFITGGLLLEAENTQDFKSLLNLFTGVW